MRYLGLALLLVVSANAMRFGRKEHAQVRGRDYNIMYRFDGIGANDSYSSWGTGFNWFWMPDTGETRPVWEGSSWVTLEKRVN